VLFDQTRNLFVLSKHSKTGFGYTGNVEKINTSRGIYYYKNWRVAVKEEVAGKVTIIGKWFLLNFIVCLAPLFISLVIKSNNIEQIFSSFLSYIFTLFIVSTYLYENYLKITLDVSPFADLLRTFTIVVSFFIIIFFVLFNTATNVQSWAINKIIILSISVFGFSLIFAFLLNFPIISSQAIKESEFMNRRRLLAKNTENLSETLRREGIE
jgi:hypothetical protein